MKFAHLIEINDPLNPLIDPLSRVQLWRGLVLRAEEPERFVPHLDRCRILEKSPHALSRELQYGDLKVCDRVTFIAEEQLVYQVPPQQDIPASSLTVTIEEPEPEVLFVRFEYDSGGNEQTDAENALYDEYRRSAYVESDIDTISLIRQLAEEGQLGE